MTTMHDDEVEEAVRTDCMMDVAKHATTGGTFLNNGQHPLEELEAAVSTDDTQQGDDDDHDADSYCYESDYEYEAEMMDGSDDDDYFDAPEQNIHQEYTEPSSLKKVDMVVEDDDNPEGISRSVDSMLPTPSYVPPVAALPSTVSIDNESLAFCRLCQHEEGHIPVLDCSLVQEWNRLVRDCGNGILDVDPQLMMFAMRHRVEECYTYLHTTLRTADRWPIPTGNFNPPTIDKTVLSRLPQTDEQPQNRSRRTGAERNCQRRLEIHRRGVRPRSQSPDRMPERMLGTMEDFRDLSPNASPARQRRRRSPEARPVSAIPPARADLFFAHKTRESVAADLRAHRWDVQAWRYAMRRRRDLEQDLAVLPAAWRTLENQRREQLRIEREIVHLGLDSMTMLTPEHERDTTPVPDPPATRIYEDSRQQILEDHHNFLERTMPVNAGIAAAPEPTPTPGLLGMLSNLVSGTTPADPNASHATVDAATANAPANTATRNDPPSATVALPQMYAGTAMNYDESWTCPICLDDDVEPEDRLCVRFPYRGRGLEYNFCGHFYCRECWTHYIQAWLEDVRGAGGGSLTSRLYCPDPQCYARVTRDHVQRVVRGIESQENSDVLLTHTLVRLHDDLALNSFVEGNRGTICWCPGPNCNRIMVQRGADVFVPSTGRQPVGVGYGFFTSCGSCEFNFCFRCGNTREGHQHEEEGLRCPEVIPLDDEIVQLAGGGNAVPAAERNEMLLAHRNNIATAAAVDNTVPAVERNDMLLAHRNNITAAAAPNLDLVLNRPRLRRNRNYDDVNTNKIRLCPSCKIPIEKNGGCAHMRCKCGHHFCWLCMSDVNNNMGHFCGREGARDIFLNNMRDRRTEEANPLVFNLARIDLDYLMEQLHKYVQGDSNLGKEINSSYNELVSQQRGLYRFAHYYNRFIFHNQGQQFSESQCDCVANRASNYTHFSTIKSATDTDFFQVANERLVTARRILKYSYCLLYFKLKVTSPLHDTTASGSEISEGPGCPNDNALSASLPVQLAIFMDNQERLERLTEQLSFMSENATTPSDRQRVMDMIQTVDKCLLAVTELSFEQDI